MVEESLKYMNRSGRMLMQLSVPVKLRMTLEKWKIGGRNASGYIVPSLGLKQELEEFYNTPSEMITVLPNGINTERFHPKNRSRWADTVRRELGIPKGMRLAAFASHSYFGEGKGLRIILEAVALLGRQDVGVVVIGGDDPLSYKERAKRLGIGSQVFFVGHTGEIEKYYSVADVVVIASIYESFSLVAHEAAASGVPLVATAVHGVIDMFKAAIPGSLVERRPEAFACGIARLLDDAAFYRQASAEARRVAEQVSWDVVAPRFLEILKTYWR
jgi:glycosyltransferase involved in cell wall biosynthesis